MAAPLHNTMHGTRLRVCTATQARGLAGCGIDGLRGARLPPCRTN